MLLFPLESQHNTVEYDLGWLIADIFFKSKCTSFEPVIDKQEQVRNWEVLSSNALSDVCSR